ncbi:hypothetical protein BH09MYX1_BH09MYX1_16850 [soil metagenome]
MSQISPTGWKSLGRYGSIGFELIASIVIGFFIGRWFDRHFAWHNVGTIGGVLLGTYTGFRTLFKRAKEAERQMDLDDARERKRAREDATIEKVRSDDAKAQKESAAQAKDEDTDDEDAS